MDRAPAAAGVGRYLVLFVAEIREQRLAAQLDVGGRILVRKIRGRPGMKDCVRLQGQLVPGQVLRFQRGGGPEVRERRGDRLPGQRKHEVQVDVVEARTACGADGPGYVTGPVDPAQPGQRLVVEALRAQGEAVDSCLAVTFRIAALHRSRVGLQRNLGLRAQRESFRDRVDQRRDLRWRKQARRAAAQEHADQRPAVGTL